MIFSKTHIEQIITGTKTQTRRSSNRYHVGRTYAIQPCRTCKGIAEGRILITAKKAEYKHYLIRLSLEDAKAEGGYTPEEYEELYRQMHRGWMERWAYTFKFLPSGDREKR